MIKNDKKSMLLILHLSIRQTVNYCFLNYLYDSLSQPIEKSVF